MFQSVVALGSRRFRTTISQCWRGAVVAKVKNDRVPDLCLELIVSGQKTPLADLPSRNRLAMTPTQIEHGDSHVHHQSGTGTWTESVLLKRYRHSQ